MEEPTITVQTELGEENTSVWLLSCFPAGSGVDVLERTKRVEYFCQVFLTCEGSLEEIYPGRTDVKPGHECAVDDASRDGENRVV